MLLWVKSLSQEYWIWGKNATHQSIIRQTFIIIKPARHIYLIPLSLKKCCMTNNIINMKSYILFSTFIHIKLGSSAPLLLSNMRVFAFLQTVMLNPGIRLLFINISDGLCFFGVFSLHNWKLHLWKADHNNLTTNQFLLWCPFIFKWNATCHTVTDHCGMELKLFKKKNVTKGGVAFFLNTFVIMEAWGRSLIFIITAHFCELCHI